MRILVLTNLYPPHYLGGYELICYNVVNALRRRGHSIHILTSNHRLADAPQEPEEKGVDRSLRLHGFYGHPWLPIYRLYGLEREDNARLRETVQRLRPDLVYVWNMGGLPKSMLLTLQALGIPTAFYISDHWISRGLASDVWLNWWNGAADSNRARAEAAERGQAVRVSEKSSTTSRARTSRPHPVLLPRLVRTLCERSGIRRRLQAVAPTNPIRHIAFQRLTFCSRALRQATVQAGFNVAQGGVIYPPVDTARFTGDPAQARRPVRRLLYVGRLAPDKGIMTALRALALASEKFRGELVLYGRGDAGYTAELKRFITDHRLRVQLACASLETMPEVYRRHDVLVFPSEWQEPFALTPLEAMASGLPVIGTTTGGSAELFRHADNALVFSPGNAEELARCILEMMADDDLRVRCATAGFCEVRQRFSESVMVDHVEKFLEETRSHWRPAPLPDYDA